MVPRKRRVSYKRLSAKIATEHNEQVPEEWEDIWALLDKYEVNTRKQTRSQVYLITDKYHKLAKIGRSINPSARVKNLSTGSPNELHLMAYCKNESPFTEKELHERLKEHRIHGEWFTMCEETVQVMREMREFGI